METTSNSTSSQTLYTNKAFIVSLGVETILGVLGLLGNILLLYVLFKTKQIVLNVRLLLANTSVALALVSGHLILKSAISLLTIVSNETSFIFSSDARCSVFETPLMIAVQVVHLSLFGLSIERAYASANFKNQQHKLSTKRIQASLVVQWILALGIAVLIFVGPLPYRLKYCNVLLASNIYWVITISVSFMTINLIALISYFVILRNSRRQLIEFAINQAQLTLGHRVQLRQSIELTETLLPSVILHVLCYFTSLMEVLLVRIIDITDGSISGDSRYHIEFHNKLAENISDTDLVISQYCNYCLFGLHILLHPILCIARNSRFTETFKQAFNIPIKQKPSIIKSDGTHLDKRYSMIELKALRKPLLRNISSRSASALFTLPEQSGGNHHQTNDETTKNEKRISNRLKKLKKAVLKDEPSVVINDENDLTNTEAEFRFGELTSQWDRSYHRKARGSIDIHK